MATNKEEVLFKVKAELAGFKKSMDELKKMAKETSKNVEKSMNMDLSDEGNKAGKSFTDGMNRQIKNATDSVRSELKKVAEQASEIKIGFDTSGIDYVKRQISDISNKKISTASDRASASMSNNANAPNSSSMVNAMVGAANVASISKMSEAVSSVGKSVKATTDNMKQSFSSVSKKSSKELEQSLEMIMQKEARLTGKIREAKDELGNYEIFIKRLKESLESLGKEKEKVNNKLEGLKSGSEDYAKLSKELDKLNDQYKTNSSILDEVTKKAEILSSTIARLEGKLIQVRSQKLGTDYEKALNKKEIENYLKIANERKDELQKARNAGNNLSIVNYGNSLNEWIKKLDQLGTSVIKLAPLIKALGKEFNDTEGIRKSTLAISKFINVLSSISSVPAKAAKGISSIFGNALVSSINIAGNEVSKFGDRINQLGIKVLNPINMVKLLGQTAKSVATSFGSAGWNGITNTFKNIAKSAKDLKDALSNKIDKACESTINAFNRLKDGIKSIPTLVKKIPSAMDSALKSTGNSISSLGVKIKSLSDSVASIPSKVSSGLKNGLGALKASVSIENIRKQTEAYKDFKNEAKNALSVISNGANKVLSPIKAVGERARNAASGFRKMGDEAKGASGKIDKLKGSFTGLLSKLAMFFSIYQLFGLMKTGTQDAIKYEAAVMNIQRTFGKASQSLMDFANKNAVAFGLSKKQVAEYGNIFSVIMKDVNIAMAKVGDTSDDIAKRTMDMSQQLLESAGKISSALGYDVNYVLEGLRSGLLGSSEAVDQFGLNLKIANLEASDTFRQVANGAKSWNELTVAQQQYIIAQEIINQTTSKYGAIMKNTASLHNQYLAQLANTKLALGNLGKVLWTAILPPLINILAILEKVFNYAASAMTALLGLFGIKVDFSSPTSAGGALGGLEDGLSGIEDAASDASDSLGDVGDSATDSAKKTEEAAKKVKRALAGFDQINVLNIKEDKDDNKDNPISGFDPSKFKPTPLDLGDFGVAMPELTKSTMEGLNKFKDFADKMKKLLKELSEPFKAAWDELGDRWIAAWNRLKKEFKHFCESLANFLKSVWTHGGKEFVQHMAEIALAVGIAAMEIGGTILHALAQLWEHLDPETNGHTQAFLDALNEVAVKVRDLILGINEHLESLMKHGGQECLNALGDMFMDLGTAAVRSLGVVVDAIDGLLDHLDPVTNEITRNMLEAWTNAFKAIGDAALAFADLLESALANGGQDIINSLGDLAMQIGATMGTVVEIVADSAGKLFDHLDPAKNKNTAGALEGFKYFVDSIRGFVEMLGECFRTFMDNGGQEFVNNIGDIVAILIDLASTIAGDIINSITAFMNSWIGQTLIEAAARALELVSYALKGLLEMLKPLTPLISGVVAGFAVFAGLNKVVTIVKGVAEAFGILKAVASALWAVLMANPVALVIAAIVALGVALVAAYNKWDAFREAVDKVLDCFKGLADAIKGALSNIIRDVKNIFKDIIDIIVGIFTGDGERVGEAVRNLVTHILQYFGDLFLGIADIGINLVTGLAKGIWEGVKQAPKLIGEALTGLYNFVCDFFKGLFGIHSPSTVFAGFGVNLIEGLAQGVKSVFNLMGDAFHGMLNFAKDTITKEWKIITDVFNKLVGGIKDIFNKIKDFSIPKPKVEWDSIKEKASNIVDKVKDKVKSFKADLPKPSVVWDSVKNTAERTIDNIKRGVQNFKASLPKPDLKWDSIKTSVSNMLTNLKRTVSNFKWELPKPKLPKFKISGGEAPWGFMGKGSLPKIDVSWNKDGGIMTRAMLFGMNGNTLLGGGEAGPK